MQVCVCVGVGFVDLVGSGILVDVDVHFVVPTSQHLRSFAP